MGDNDAVTKFEVAELRIDGFRGLPAGRGDFIESPEFVCFGHEWALRIYPGGYADSEDGNVGVYLFHESSGTIEIRGSFAVKKSNSEMAVCENIGTRLFQPQGDSADNDTWGLPDFAPRSTILAALQGGTLVIEVRLTKTGPPESRSAPFVPENPLSKHILEKFMDEKSGDVVFEVGGGRTGATGRKRAKTPPATFHAHSLILGGWSPTLAELCRSDEPVRISNVKPCTFRQMLRYMYGGKAFDEDNPCLGSCRELIEAADRFGVASLKLEAEAAFVTSMKFTLDNVVENLLYADALNCALLREAAVDFMVKNGREAVEKLSFSEVPQSIIPDLLTAMTRGRGDAGADNCDFGAMGVSGLRKRLHEKGLDIDGSRQTMIGLLEKNSSK